MSSARLPHVVMVSWKDPRHPRAGGAERFTETALGGLVTRGVRVTWFTPRIAGVPDVEERPNGVQVRRIGTTRSHLWAAVRSVRRCRTRIDLVIDQINTYPMGTLLAVGPERGLVLVHQLARGVWFREAPLPIAALGWVVEPLVLWLHRRRTAITVSPSTATDLRRLGFRRVEVVPNAVAPPPTTGATRTVPAPPVFVALGRWVRMKRFEHALDAFARARERIPDARLVLIGRGGTPYAERLAARAAVLPGVDVLRDASEEEKWATLSRATALVATSVREGWGINVGEAHAVGTPSIAYDVPGLRDSTLDGRDGMLVAPTPAALADAMVHLATDAGRWSRLSAGAHASAESFTPEALETAFADVIERALTAAGRRG